MHQPILLSHEQHVSEIMHRWRLEQIDRISSDLLFEDHLRRVAEAMYEPPPVMRLPKWPVWLMACLLWAPIIVVGWEILRP